MIDLDRPQYTQARVFFHADWSSLHHWVRLAVSRFLVSYRFCCSAGDCNSHSVWVLVLDNHFSFLCRILLTLLILLMLSVNKEDVSNPCAAQNGGHGEHDAYKTASAQSSYFCRCVSVGLIECVR